MVAIVIFSLSTRAQIFRRLSNNLSGQYKRGMGIAIHLGIGILISSIVTINSYRSQDFPRFILGREACLSISALEPHVRFLRQMLLN